MKFSLRPRNRIGVFGALALALSCAFPAAAAAAEPLKIRELFPGSTGTHPAAEYVTLQMSADEQGDLVGQELHVYGADGSLSLERSLSAAEAEGLANVASQRTMLLAGPDAAALGGDAASPDVDLPGEDHMDPDAGAVCFTGPEGAPADCVAWGGFPEGQLGGLFDPQADRAAAIADGEALERDIARGGPGFDDCLDPPSDDTGSSEADFDLAAPDPRNNESALPAGEFRCPPGAGIVSGPVNPFENPTDSAEALFAFVSLPASEPGVEFQCFRDFDPAGLPPETPPAAGEWAPCASPRSYEGLADGFHRFWVRALGSNPVPGPPANRGWQVDTVAPQTQVDSGPEDPSSGFEAAFSYSSTEEHSSFRCRLDDGAIQNCGTSASEGRKSYFDLSDGEHTFRVWATDNAGNEDPSPATHNFTVNTALGDRTPPDTQILLAPPSPSGAPTAFFAYSSSEPDSRFQCSLDGAPFAPCSELGASYGPLPNGTHVFAVRAIDRAGNVDSVPAAHVWRVAAPVPNTRIVAAPGGAIRSKRGRAVRVAFRFKADRPGSTFRCRLDLSGPYRPCTSPYRVRAKPGRHVFEVFATDSLGNEEGSPAFRIFRVRAPGAERSFFVQRGKLLNSLSAAIAPTKLPRRGLRPVALRLGSTFENLDGSDIPALRSMTLRLARGGVLNARGLPRCTRARLRQRSSARALRACRGALVGRGTVSTALRFPEGRRSRATARMLLFNAPGGLLMHVHATEPLEGVFIVPMKVQRKAKGRFANVLHARFPRLAAGFGRVSGFQMKLERRFRRGGKRTSFLLAGCPAPRGLRRVSFELAEVTYRFRGAPAVRNSTINSCRAIG